MPRGNGRKHSAEVSCKLCEHRMSARTLSGCIAVYVAHLVQIHWDTIQGMRDNPGNVAITLEILKEQGII